MLGQLAEPREFPIIRVTTHQRTRQKRRWSYSLDGPAPLCGIVVLCSVLLWPSIAAIGGELSLPNTVKDAPRASVEKQPAKQGSGRIGAAQSSDKTQPRVGNDKQTAPRPTAERQLAKPGFAATKAAVPRSDAALDKSDSNPGKSTETEVPVEPQITIDGLVFQRLAQLNMRPADLCPDEVFLRRIYVDTLGTLPTADEAQQFLDDRNPKKRSKLIEKLLERPEFADYWAMKWSDILRVKSEFPIKLWPNAAQAYHRWIRTAIANNMRYDDFVRELLTASGSNFRTPQVNFYRAVQSQEPKAISQAVALTFLCERADHWPAERLEGMSLFFSQVGYKPTGEWKEEIVFFDRHLAGGQSDETPLRAVTPNGATVEISLGQDPRRVFADWLVDDHNPQFSRAIANRVWYWLVGRGIVSPPDDIRSDNPPSNPALLKHLGEELVAADYDLRHLYRIILNSRTYQLTCTSNSEDPRAAENFASYPVRRLDAEVLIDAICQITATSESYSSIIPEPYTFLPDGQRAISLPDGSITSSFLEMFGRPPRDSGLESERNNQLTSAQALHLLNSNHLRGKLKRGSGLKDLFRGTKNRDATAELIYLAILSRRPTSNEKATVRGLCGNPNGARDVAWALVNSDEFLFRH